MTSTRTAGGLPASLLPASLLPALLLLASLLIVTGGAQAACTQRMPTAPSLAAATAVAGLDRSVLAIGRATRVALAPVAAIHFLATPGKTGGPYAGLVAFDVKQAGAFRIVLGDRAWLDVVEGGATIAPVAHQHGAACSGIAKQVTFPLVTVGT